MHHSITAEFSLNTPLFASGADRDSPELRVTEIKAALRFWWRAMNYSLYVTDPDGFVDTEAQLFGGANASQGQGVLVSLIGVDNMSDKASIRYIYKDFEELPGARYLGYGLMAYADSNGNPNANPPKPPAKKAQLDRSCIKPGGTFKIRLNWRNKAASLGDTEFQAHLVQALKTFGTFGGLGSRSRRGYGSVTLQSLK